MEFLSYDIASMDFRTAGAASRGLKDWLLRIGADAEAIRRTMIAAYEAEMNVVIHSHGGKLEASLSGNRVDVDVVDTGPGIPDVDAALTEGFSTASPEVRALGFGAGLGLPNIKKNSDRMRLSSHPGDGTRVSFTVCLHQEQTGETDPVSLSATPELCRDCRACLAACPTGAMRIRNGRPSVLEHLCIDCAQCIAACPFQVLGVRREIESLDDLPDRSDMILVVPPALLADFGAERPPATVLGSLRSLGFAEVMTSEPYEKALRETTEAAESPRPVITPVCPAVVNLIELRFPSLIPHLAPLASPLEAAQTACAGRPAAYVVSCPAQRSVLLQQTGSSRDEYLTPEFLRAAVMTAAADEPDRDVPIPTAQRPAKIDPHASPLRVAGASHVIAVLEQIENGLLNDASTVEPYICEGGCFGSPLFINDHHLVARRWSRGRATVDAHVPPGTCDPHRRSTAGAASSPLAVPRRRSLTARPGLRLDADMRRAIEKLGRLQALRDSLHGKDCGACGAPTCAALAEDIVTERATIDLCPYLATDITSHGEAVT